MARMNQQSSNKVGKLPSKFLKDRKTSRKTKNIPEGRIKKSVGNKRNLGA